MIKRFITHPFVVFPLFSCIFFWPFTLQLLSLKNDALTYYYPIRTLISDALNNEELPLWTPYINMGYPLHADLQSGAWNPVIWLFSLLTDYSLAAFHWEFLFYISFAGIGFYYLCRQQGAGIPAALILAFSYQFSGFMLDSAQFFSCISSACYLPFIVLFFTRTMRLQRWQDAMYAGIFLSLLFTGGYPSIFVITVYLLIAYAIFTFSRANNRVSFLKQTGLKWMLCLFTFLLLSLPAILSFAEYLPLIKRADGLSLAAAGENSMHPTSIISLLVPYANTANARAVNASILMQSIYIGLIPLIFLKSLLWSRKLRKNTIALLLIAGSLIFLFLAWGQYFFVHKLAYHFVPLMDTFRHPGVFRLFAIFLVLLAVNSAIEVWAKGSGGTQLVLQVVKLLFFAMLTCGVVLAFKNGLPILPDVHEPALILQRWRFTDRYLVQLPVTLFILWLSYKTIQNGKNRYWLCLLAAADLFVFVQFVMPVTVTGARSMTTVEAHLARTQQKFPLPNQRSIHYNSMNSEDSLLITGSKLLFSKKVGRNNYFITPGNLQLQDSFYASPIRDAVFANSLVYLADTMAMMQPNFSNTKPAAPALAFLNKNTFAARDTAAKGIQIYAFAANSMRVKLDGDVQGKIVFLQNNYPGWQAFADGKRQTIETVNVSFMSVDVQAGTRELLFVYRPVKIIYAWYFSAVCWLACIIMVMRDLFLRWPAMKRRQGIS